MKLDLNFEWIIDVYEMSIARNLNLQVIGNMKYYGRSTVTLVIIKLTFVRTGFAKNAIFGDSLRRVYVRIYWLSIKNDNVSNETK